MHRNAQGRTDDLQILEAASFQIKPEKNLTIFITAYTSVLGGFSWNNKRKGWVRDSRNALRCVSDRFDTFARGNILITSFDQEAICQQQTLHGRKKVLTLQPADTRARSWFLWRCWSRLVEPGLPVPQTGGRFRRPGEYTEDGASGCLATHDFRTCFRRLLAGWLCWHCKTGTHISEMRTEDDGVCTWLFQMGKVPS